MASNPIPGGYGVTSTIQAILERRREEARQAMLDKLQADNVRSQIADRDRDRELATTSEARAKALTDAQIAESRERRNAAMLSTLPEGEMEITPEFASNNNELLQLMTSRGMVRNEAPATPMVASSYGAALPDISGTGDNGDSIVNEAPVAAGPPMPAKQFYRGSPKFQQEQLERKQRLDYANNLPDSPLKTFLLTQAAAGGGQVPAQLLGDRYNYVYGPGGNLVRKDKLEPFSEVTELNHPPQQNTASRPLYVGVDDATGRPINQMPDGSYQIAPIVGGGRIGAKPSNQRPPDIVPPQAWDRVRVAASAPNVRNRQAAINVAMANVKAIALGRGVSPQVLIDVESAIADVAKFRERGLPEPSPEQIVERFVDPVTKQPTITEEEKAQIMSLLYGFLAATGAN